jgi:hypothetical protein
VPPAPPFAYVTAEGTTFAHTAAEAAHYGRLAEHLSRRTRALLQIQEFEPFELRVLDREVPGTAQASAMRWYDADGLITRYIRLGTERRDAAPLLIAHELVHWHVEETWGLPLVLEEGLAEMVAASFVNVGEEILAEHRALYEASVDAPILQGDRPLQITRADWRELKHEEKRQLYAWGYVHAAELGVDQLRDFRAALGALQD